MIAAILLAAGQSRRFGPEDKLEAMLDGLPLRLHAARTLAALPVAHRIVVDGSAPREWPGFDVVTNDDPDAGMARSVALGVALARRKNASAVLIALADMPLVPRNHFERLIERAHDAACLGSRFETRPTPPAVFGADWFERLEGLTGDHGARDLLADAELLLGTPEDLLDIDRPEDLARLALHRDHRAELP